jgi:hypothetical protein
MTHVLPLSGVVVNTQRTKGNGKPLYECPVGSQMGGSKIVVDLGRSGR